jgi:predicted PurR-regulated permease PerM
MNDDELDRRIREFEATHRSRLARGFLEEMQQVFLETVWRAVVVGVCIGLVYSVIQIIWGTP